ncbi:MAG: hypothetical protein Q8Q97_02460 [bacterium]|nr:hypothetical protein [bacterium]
MKKDYLIIIVVVIVAFGALLFSFLKNANEKQLIASLEPQQNNEGLVTIAVTPKLSSEISFQILVDTHSEELNYDFTQIAFLVDENGKEYKPVSWDGDPPGGHHREGVLAFGIITPLPQTLQLVIKGMGGVPERKFVWITRP